jgi:hypothetical protein
MTTAAQIEQLLTLWRRKFVNFCGKPHLQCFIRRKPQISDLMRGPIFLREIDMIMEDRFFYVAALGGGLNAIVRRDRHFSALRNSSLRRATIRASPSNSGYQCHDTAPEPDLATD